MRAILVSSCLFGLVLLPLWAADERLDLGIKEEVEVSEKNLAPLDIPVIAISDGSNLEPAVCAKLADQRADDGFIVPSPLHVAISGVEHPLISVSLQSLGDLRDPQNIIVYLDLKNWRLRPAGDAEPKRWEAQTAALEELKSILRGETLKSGDQIVLVANTGDNFYRVSSWDAGEVIAAIDRLAADPGYRTRISVPTSDPAQFWVELEQGVRSVYRLGYDTRLLFVGMELPNGEAWGDPIYELLHASELKSVPNMRPVQHMAGIFRRLSITVASYNLCDRDKSSCTWLSKHEGPFPIAQLGGVEYRSGTLARAVEELRSVCVLQATVPDLGKRGRIKISGAPKGIELRWPPETGEEPPRHRTQNQLDVAADLACGTADETLHRDCRILVRLALASPSLSNKFLRNGVQVLAHLWYENGSSTSGTVVQEGWIKDRKILDLLAQEQQLARSISLPGGLSVGRVRLVVHVSVPGTDLEGTWNGTIDVPGPAAALVQNTQATNNKTSDGQSRPKAP